jgi:hypothetical protein
MRPACEDESGQVARRKGDTVWPWMGVAAEFSGRKKWGK